MKILIFGEDKERIENLVEEAGFEQVSENPEFIVSYGGDGGAGRRGVPGPAIGPRYRRPCPDTPDGPS